MLHERRKSSWAYESLPYFYMASGVLVPVFLRNAWGLFSGLILLLAGAMVWRMRRAHRNPSPDMGGHAGTDAVSAHHDTESARLVWRKEYECGHAMIDSWHRNLFASSAALHKAIHDRHSKLDIELLLDELIKEMSQHFHSEEVLMQSSGHPSAREHQEAHQQLLARCHEFSRLFQQGRLSPAEMLHFIAVDIVSRHIVSEVASLRAHFGAHLANEGAP